MEYDLAVTTVFTQPPECTSGITTLATDTNLWQNAINPVPSLTLTSCYPSQFYLSAMATASIPPFSQLVCPNKWETYNINSTYIVCCPYDYGLFIPFLTHTERPGLGAVCTKTVWADVLMDMTIYDKAGLATVIPTKAGGNGALILATAFDGILATAVVSSSETGSPSKSEFSSPATSAESISSPPITSSTPSPSISSSKSISSSTRSVADLTSTNLTLAIIIMAVAMTAAAAS